MPGAIKTVQTSFSRGELDPLLAGRIDIKHYYAGAERARQVIVLPQGGVRRRPGTLYADTLPEKISRITSGVTISTPNGGTGANANDDDTSTEVTTTAGISTTNPYVVVHYDLGSAKVVEFADVVGFRLDTGGDSNEFVIQYSTDDVSWTTLGTTIPDKTEDRTRRKTGPITARYWRFARIGSTDLGAALATIDEFTLWEKAGAVSEGKDTPFEFSSTQRYMIVFSDRNARIYIAGVAQADVRSPFASNQLDKLHWTQSLDTMFLAHQDVKPQRLMRQGADDEWQMEDVPWVKIPQHAFDLSTSNPGTTLTPSATEGTIKLTTGAAHWTDPDDVDQFVEGNGGRARITQINSTTEAIGITIIPFFDTATIASGDWTKETGYEDAWSTTRGWPRTTALHQQRFWVGGSRDLPDNLWGSRIADLFDFNLGQNLDNEGIAITIDSAEVAAIHDMISANKRLQIFTEASEQYVPAFDAGITPSNIKIEDATVHGTKEGVRVQRVADAVLFLERGGSQVREFVFSETTLNFTADAVSLLSSHLLDNPVSMAHRRSRTTDRADLIFVVNTDGTCAVFTTLRGQEIAGWTLIATNGKFLDVGVDDTDVYFIVERTINGNTVRYVERLSDNLHMDAGIYVTTGLPTSTITGLDHLEGATVEVVVDGAVHPSKTVSGGQITLDRDAETSVEVGLQFAAPAGSLGDVNSGLPIVKLMPFATQLQDGTVLGDHKRIIEATVELKDTIDALVSGERLSFRQFGPAGDGSPLDAAVSPFTGRKMVQGRLGWNDLGQIDVTQDLPVDLTLLAVEVAVQL